VRRRGKLKGVPLKWLCVGWLLVAIVAVVAAARESVIG
jgi:hypothetical protein